VRRATTLGAAVARTTGAKERADIVTKRVAEWFCRTLKAGGLDEP
jgi:hypothetical protein